ncbi:HlyD family efflux transporter periplasmic adaptor subunit [Niabella yanshanensis]|uniref:HlyD family efflux transporter periplasmic adaptor subunit n=1 Tax=Niabella yanshanensis TaxID=577386 RepID=A0ABZ0W5X3_9BACT|nr:HlyD family efflux transporter periplasmic adaptor subunit [Niabella yanshanensis]WQD37481.1 HlyD family efflux transporter periplasmic adaptor subunit [Niabella yanshanensis]
MNFPKTSIIYLVTLVMVMAALVALPFISTTISTRATGITRPVTERSDIKPVVSGIVEKLFYKEGELVQAGEIIAIIKDEVSPVQAVSNNYDINQRTLFIHDLKILTTSHGNVSFNSLSSALYKQQLNRFKYQLADQQASLRKVQRELDINNTLLKDKVIAPKEAFDKQVENEKLLAAYEAFTRNQLAQWQQELATYEAELSQLQAAGSKILADQKNFQIKAPVSGVIQGINSLYEGSMVQAGQTIATLSPESSLIAECYVNTRDVGLLKTGQAARFQVDAFDYNYFGVLTGTILSIDNDFSVVNEQLVFKVRCSFDTTQLHLKNGFPEKLKKGLSLQARFVVAERTLWQLLFDKIDDWLNPAAPGIANAG